MRENREGGGGGQGGRGGLIREQKHGEPPALVVVRGPTQRPIFVVVWAWVGRNVSGEIGKQGSDREVWGLFRAGADRTGVGSRGSAGSGGIARGWYRGGWARRCALFWIERFRGGERGGMTSSFLMAVYVASAAWKASAVGMLQVQEPRKSAFAIGSGMQ